VAGVRESPCVAVEPRLAERARRILKSRGLLAPGLRAGRLGGRVAFPVRDPEEAVGALAAGGVEAEPCVGVFEEAPRPGGLSGEVPGVSSYYIVGEAAIINERPGVPREELARAARLILERHPRLRGVYLKRGVEGEFRVARLELLAGEPVGETVYREYGLEFLVDIERVYVNPSLAGEHRRVAEAARDGEWLLDMFSGFGAFAIHAAALHDLTAVSVDLNPHASRLAALNAWRNRRRLRGRVVVVNSDARLLPELLRARFDRIVMNHPTAAHEFVAHACRLLGGEGGWMHVYLLDESAQSAWARLRSALVEAGCGAALRGWRVAIEYSPRLAVYALDVEAFHTSV
jgi:tRNA (guanine37-N1)-methyltransferase